MSRARSSASGSGPSSASAVGSAVVCRGSMARLLMRISCEATATNALTFPSRSDSSPASASRYASARPPSGTVRTSSWRASMSDSRRASGPSNSAIWTWVAVSGRRPSPKLTAGAAGGDRRGRRHHGDARPADPGHQLASSASWRRRPASGSTGASWCRISSTVRGEQPAAPASTGRDLGMVAQPRLGDARGRQHARDPRDPAPVSLAERVHHARPHPGLPLPGIVQQAREQHLGVGHAVRREASPRRPARAADRRRACRRTARAAVR